MENLRMPEGPVEVYVPSKVHSIARVFRTATTFIFALTIFGLGLSLMAGAASAQEMVTTHHNDVGRTGANTAETILTPSNVNSTTFGFLFSAPVDGQVYAQPLYMPNVAIPGEGTHNVVYVATEHDSVYAFDADTGGTALWHDTFLINGATTVNWTVVNVKDVYPENGITGTPVIDPTTNTLYVVVMTYENSVCIHRLHALDITTGAEKFGGPIQIAASTPGTGDGSSGGVITFNSIFENQRPGLLLLNGYVYVGFAAFGDNGDWHGWVLSYNAATLALAGQFCASPNGEGSGFWASGSGLSADNLNGGRIFVATGNGDFPTTGNVLPKGTPAPQPSTSVDYGDSIVQLTINNGALTPTDYFTPYNTDSLEAGDTDLGSGGTLILPDQPGTYPHELIQVGKQGRIYVIDRDKMTNDGSHFCNGCSTDPEILQTVTGIDGLWAMPAYWNGNVYFWGNGDSLKMYPISNGVLAAAPTSQSAETSGFPGSTPVISANGTTNGIVWTNESDGYLHNAAILRAYDATNVSHLLWASNLQTTDTPGQAVKFTLPIVANGKVYLGTYNQLDVYGIKAGTQAAATPTFTPAAGAYTTSQSVQINDANSGATIYYTMDGSMPTTASAVYSTPISVTTSTTINAIATASGYLTSATGSALFSIAGKPVAPVITPGTGSYTGSASVTMTDATSGASIYFTTNGTTPTQGSTKYKGAIAVTSSETIKAIAAVAGVGNSPVTTATYTMTPASNTTINYGLGFANATGLQFNGSTDLDDSRLQLTNGGASEAGSAFYTTPVNIQGFTTDFSFQISDAVADGMTFTIHNAAAGASALGVNGGNLGYGGGAKGIGNSIAIKFDIYSNSGEGSDSTGLYQNAASPILPSIDMTTSGLVLNSGDAIQAHITYNGTTLAMTLTDAVTNKSFSQSWTVNIPSVIGSNTAYVGFTGGTGGSSSSQKVETWTFTSNPPLASVTAYSSGFTSASGLQLNGSSTLLTASNALALTSGKSQAGSFFYTTPVNVQSFTNTFTFQLPAPLSDGITFVLEGNGPTSIGDTGGALGYSVLSSEVHTFTKSVAIKFDVYSNSGEGIDSTGVYQDGAAPITPFVDMTSSGLVLTSGHVFNVTMSYNGTTLTMTITDATTAASFTNSWTVNIPTIVGGNTAYVGFTGGSGGTVSTQEILTWTYTPGTPSN
jgi:hypothetical protein